VPKGIFTRLGILVGEVKRGETSLAEVLAELQPDEFSLSSKRADICLRDAMLKAFEGLVEYVECKHCKNFHVFSLNGEHPAMNYVETNNIALDGDWCMACADTDAAYSNVMGTYICIDDAIDYYATLQSFRDRRRSDVVLLRWAEDNASVSTHNYSPYEYIAAHPDVADNYPEYFDCEFEGDDDDDRDADGHDAVCAGRTHRLIRGYHQSNPQMIGTGAADGVNLGLEIEVESRNEEPDDITDFVEAVSNAMPPGYAGFETDGSLDCGVEIVTGYGSLDAHRAALAQILKHGRVQSALSDSVTSGETTSGLHIHMSKEGMGPLQCLKLDKFVFSRANRDLWDTFSRRDENRYATFVVKQCDGSIAEGFEDIVRAKLVAQNLADKGLTARDRARLPPSRRLEAYKVARSVCFDRYSAINWQKTPTVEFRMFQASLDYTTLMGTLELVRGLYSFTRDMPMRSMNWPEFFTWAEQPANIRDMRDFLAYAAARKMIMPKAFHKRIPGAKKAKGKAKPTPTDAGINAAGDLLRDALVTEPMQIPFPFDRRPRGPYPDAYFDPNRLLTTGFYDARAALVD
jgi:hypothetical protein